MLRSWHTFPDSWAGPHLHLYAFYVGKQILRYQCVCVLMNVNTVLPYNEVTLQCWYFCSNYDSNNVYNAGISVGPLQYLHHI